MKSGKPLTRSSPLERKRVAPLKRTSPPKRSRGISPASKAQKTKIAANPYCLACGAEASEWLTIDPAHLAARTHRGCQNERCVIPLCRTTDGGCHRALDEGRLDILPSLVGRYTAELAHALEHYEGNLIGLLQRLTGQRYVPEADRREV